MAKAELVGQGQGHTTHPAQNLGDKPTSTGLKAKQLLPTARGYGK